MMKRISMKKKTSMAVCSVFRIAPNEMIWSEYVLATIILLAIVFAAGCGGKNGPDRMAVSGAVQFDDAPLARGRILFVPEPPLKGPVASAAIVDGAYKIAARDGVVAGKHRVEIEGTIDLGFPIDDDVAYAERRGAPLPPNPVPERYNRKTILSADMKPEGTQTFDFQLWSSQSTR
jgi:hypothetical protein